MKSLRFPTLALIALCAALPLRAAADSPERARGIASTISAVTVYTDRAVVTRAATIEVPAGAGEIVFADLPDSLQEQSLQVSGRGTAQATILDVSARRTFTDVTPNERVRTIEDQLRALRRQVRALEDRDGLLDARAASLERVEAALFAPASKDVPRADLEQLNAALTYVSEQRARIAADRSVLDDERAELDRKVGAAESQLAEVRGSGRRAVKTVTVRILAAQAGRLDLALAYTVPGASWAPSYDARITSGERGVQLGYFGLVRQNTGEDWNDVALTLSTARPGLGGAAPKLEPWALEVFDPIALQKQAALEQQARRRELRMMEMARPAAAPVMALDAGSPPPPETTNAFFAEASVEAGATSATFRIATATSVPTDNSPQKVPVTSTLLDAQAEYATTPKRQTVAFLTSKVLNNSEFPLLPGALHVFLDGTFVATSRLATVMPGERFDLALGADEGIAIKHKRLNRFVEQTGLTNSGTRVTYNYLITVQNNKRTAERVIVTDQVPLSRHEKVTVKQLVPAPAEVKPDAEGLLKWTLDLKPGEKRELAVKFAVEHPNDVQVTGLE